MNSSMMSVSVKPIWGSRGRVSHPKQQAETEFFRQNSVSLGIGRTGTTSIPPIRLKS